MQIKYTLSEDQMPKTWYNIQADLPKPLPGVLNPATGQPITLTDSLSARILDIRKQDLAQPNRETLLGYNLSVLCDNTERKPVNLPKFNQLAS